MACDHRRRLCPGGVGVSVTRNQLCPASLLLSPSLPRDYDAVLFDLDGVLTKTASVHAAAWKKLFDGFLEQRAADTGEAVRCL